MPKKRYEHKITLGKDWHGNLIRKSFYSTKSKADAKRKAERYRTQYELEILCGGEPVRKKLLFKDFAIPCIEQYKKPFVKGNTYGNNCLTPMKNRLIPYFGDAELDNILPVHVQAYINEMAKKYKPETIKKDINIFSFVMQNAFENGLCKTNPVTQSVRLPKNERAEKHAYTQEEYDKVYEFAKNYPNGLSVLALLVLGISRSELLGLQWKDFDAEKGILHVKQGLVAYSDADRGWVLESDGLKNDYRCRTIPIVDEELLQRLREKPRQITYKQRVKGREEITVETTHIFHSPEGKPYEPQNWWRRVFKPFMEALSEAHPEIPKLTAHEFRHTRATLWIAQGVTPMMTARLLGHSDLKMLMKIYDHTNVETLRKALEGAVQEQK